MYLNSSKVYPCFQKDACLGGFSKETKYPVSCAQGYEGVLCHSCAFVDGNKYMW